MPKVLVLLAQGCEELEAVTIIDVLRRGGVDVVAAGLDSQPVKASRGVMLLPDMSLDKALAAHAFDMVVLPGGMGGTKAMAADARVAALLRDMAAAGKWVAAICAAPMVLAQAGLLAGKTYTAYPGVLEPGAGGGACSGGAVEVDGPIITSRGPGTAMDFALKLVELTTDLATRKRVEKDLVR